MARKRIFTDEELKTRAKERGKETLTGSPSAGITSTRNVAREVEGNVHHRFNTPDGKGGVTQRTHPTPTDKITNPFSNAARRTVKPYTQTKQPDETSNQPVPTKRGYTPDATSGTEQNRSTPKSQWTHDQKGTGRGSVPKGTPKPKGQGALGKLRTLFGKKP